VAYIVIGWFVLHGSLDTVGQEAEDGSNPQQDGEAPKKLTTELDPLRGCGGWSESIGPIPSQNVLSPLVSETLGSEERYGWACGANLSLTTSLQFLGRGNNVLLEKKHPIW
jgi:hypothetical protein